MCNYAGAHSNNFNDLNRRFEWLECFEFWFYTTCFPKFVCTELLGQVKIHLPNPEGINGYEVSAMQPWQQPLQPMQQMQPIQGLQPFGSVQSMGQLVPSAPMHMPPQYVGQPIQMPPPPPQIIYYPATADPQSAPTSTQQPQMNTLKQKGKDKRRNKKKEKKRRSSLPRAVTHKLPPERPLGRSLQDPDVGQDPTDDVRPLDPSLGADVEVSLLTNASRRRLIAPRKKDPNHRSIHQKLQVLQHDTEWDTWGNWRLQDPRSS